MKNYFFLLILLSLSYLTLGQCIDPNSVSVTPNLISTAGGNCEYELTVSATTAQNSVKHIEFYVSDASAQSACFQNGSYVGTAPCPGGG